MQRIRSSGAAARSYRVATRPFAAEAPVGPRWIHPRFRQLAPPVIVIGMHRSGTSLVAGMLGALGVYVGPEFGAPAGGDLTAQARAGRLSGYAEAAAFFRVNEQLLRAGRASWSRVEPFLQRRGQSAWGQSAALALQAHTCGSLLRDFLRPLSEDYQGPWGWKDPRNSLTLPLWRQLFPEVRIVHVVRNPDAVVRSLHRRALQWHEAGTPGTRHGLHPSTVLKSTARKLGLLAPLRPDPCLDPDYCYELCRTYEQECVQARDGQQAYLQIPYEEILEAPDDAAFRLAHFTGCRLEADNIRRAGTLVLRER